MSRYKKKKDEKEALKESINLEELKPIEEGRYSVPEDLMCEYYAGLLIVRKKRHRNKEFRVTCRHCIHWINGRTSQKAMFDTKVCDMKPKGAINIYNLKEVFFHQNAYGDPCELFEQKPFKKKWWQK